jgi:hypothetical protein
MLILKTDYSVLISPFSNWPEEGGGEGAGEVRRIENVPFCRSLIAASQTLLCRASTSGCPWSHPPTFLSVTSPVARKLLDGPIRPNKILILLY